VALNCTAVTESLLEAELFGAVRGAYTGLDRDRPGLFRQAHRGTLFLDEVGDMPAAMQAKLLRAIESGRVRAVGDVSETAVDVRIVAATHRDLRLQVERGLFRADLYYRLAVLRVDVPPLRERLDDLPTLVAELTPRLARETGCTTIRLAAESWARLCEHDWPGNVRELHATLAAALLRAAGGEIHPRHLDLPRVRTVETGLEGEMIVSALRAAGGNIARAAARIGWTRQKLYRRMRALELRRPAASVLSAGACGHGLGGTTSSDSSTFQ
jgi:sigma-54-dependent transcriptional regulator